MSSQLIQSADERAKILRDMTCAIQTRFYRAPEAIITDDYDKSVDIWGVGVILAELLMARLRTKSDDKKTYL